MLWWEETHAVIAKDEHQQPMAWAATALAELRR